MPHSTTPAAPLTVDLLISADQWHDIEQLQQLVDKAANAAYESACKHLDHAGPDEIAINLSNDQTITELNHNFRGKNKPTNVLSFPFEDDFPDQSDGARPLGDIILAYETVIAEASEQDIATSHHIAHLVVHGVLHLFGYDHIDGKEAELMEGMECEILATLQIPSPYTDN